MDRIIENVVIVNEESISIEGHTTRQGMLLQGLIGARKHNEIPNIMEKQIRGARAHPEPRAQ